ncbi:hypothetical protein HT031_004998 [Scenedesmus sp. PABB004]|nr:hypothetical protein HT031_004998 [Scenedesmus sp. PABB004]
MAAGADCSRYFGSQTFSDCKIRLVEEPGDGDGDGEPQLKELVLPGHSMLLAVLSPVFEAKVWRGPRLVGTNGWRALAPHGAARRATADARSAPACARAQLENWSDAEPARKSTTASASAGAGKQQHSLELAVPRGQLEVGRLLLQAAYAAEPASTLAGAEQERLLQLLVLADRYEVAKVTAAAGDALAAVPLKQLAWRTVAAVHALPLGCAELPALRSIFNATADKVQAELGDLELVWGEGKSSVRQQALLALPHGALKRLLADERTRVASENTVCYTIIKWAERQAEPLQAALAKELVALVRMRHVTQLFFCSVASQSDLFQAGFKPGELMAAAALCSRGAPAATHFAAITKLPGLPSFPAWSAPARPASTK